MNRNLTLLAAAGGGGAAAAAAAALRRVAARDGRGTQDRWHAVTVNRSPSDVTEGGQLPAPLAALGDGIEVRIVPAPDAKGTEIHARGRDGEDRDRRRALRRALRESRSLLEIGEVIEPNHNRTTHPTLLNRPLVAITSHGREEGLL
jgi:hypothetical protein